SSFAFVWENSYAAAPASLCFIGAPRLCSKPPRRIDTAECRSSLQDGPTINKEEAKRNRKERRDGLSRRVLSTLCPGWTALATVCPGHATALPYCACAFPMRTFRRPSP